LLGWNNSSPPTFARVNTLKTTPENLVKVWELEGVRFETTSLTWAPPHLLFKLGHHPPLTGLGSFQNGFFYVQDPSTLLAVEMMNPRPGETILDVCAAPGGKSTYIAQKMKNEGSILARDIDAARLKLIEANAARLGATCVTTDSSPDTVAPQCDRVLVDAPCSNTGVMRRRVDLRWRIQPEEIIRLAQTQLQILSFAATRCRTGGVLVYSTCSLEPDENGAVIRQFLNSHPAWRLEEERELTPIHDQVDGAYCAKLRPASNSPLHKPDT
jgi:16S rRNA (cytosine967-C5)-methyltransferase